MHELSIAAAIAEKVREFAASEHASRVVEVRLAVGEWTCLETEQLAFCYQSITAQTEISGSALAIESVPGVVKCRHCGYTGRPRYWEDAVNEVAIPTMMCPTCGRCAEMIQGHECAIRAIRYAS